MALYDAQGVKPGSSIGSQMIRVKDAVRSATGAASVDFEFTQPAGTIIEKVLIHCKDEISLSGGSATSDVKVSIGTDDTYDGVQLIAATTIIDYDVSSTEAAGVVTSVSAKAAYSGAVAQDDVLFYGRIAAGATVVADKTGELEIHVIYRHF